MQRLEVIEVEILMGYGHSFCHTLDQLSSYGITKDSLVVQGGTVGGAMLLGYFLARKRM